MIAVGLDHCWRSDILPVNQGFLEEVEVLVVNGVRGRKLGFQREERVNVLVDRLIVGTKVIQAHLQCSTQLYRDFLLLLEYELVILHILLRVRLEVSSYLMQIETVFIRAFLSIHKKLAEFGCAEGRTQHPLHIHELIDTEDGDRALSRV